MGGMRVALGADHAGFLMKNELARHLAAAGHEVLDVGTNSSDAVDYPDIAEAVARAVLEGRSTRGIVLCGSGAGVSVAANKLPGIRAAVCHDCYTAHQAVEHDDLNLLCLGARVVGIAVAIEITAAFVAATFSGDARHVRRLDKVGALERRFLAPQ